MNADGAVPVAQSTAAIHVEARTALPGAASARPREPSSDLLAACLHLGDDDAAARRIALSSREHGVWSSMSYGQLDERSRAVAVWLVEHGVGPGERVALAGEGSGEWVAALLGILRTGAVAVPVDPKLTPHELSAVVARADLAALVASPDAAAALGTVPGAPAAAPPLLSLPDVTALPSAAATHVDVRRAADEPALIVWTSGTSSAAKGVTLSLGNVGYVVDAVADGQGLHAGDRVLAVLPPHHMLALSCSVLAPLAAGASVAFADTLMPHELLAMLGERKTTKVVAVPLLLEVLRRHLRSAPSPPDLRDLALEAVYCGGAPLDPSAIEFFAALGIGVHEGYGLTETSPTVTMNTTESARPGSVGRALPGTQIRIDDRDGDGSGEILVRSPGVMLGYWGDGAATRQAIDGQGWLRTGDLGRIDADGFLWVTGRAKNLIVLDSGKKVHPEEVEAALAASTLLAESCVLGWRGAARDRAGGEQVCAVVVPAPAQAADVTAAIDDEVRDLTRALSGYKRPTIVRVLDRPLPRSAKGAVRHAAVRALLDDQEPRR